jgi:hypothetical protein
MARSAAAASRARPRPAPSNAPLLMSASTTLRFTLRESTRSQKSKSSVNGFSARAARIDSSALSPTPFTPPSPKRIFPATTEKSTSDSFTSGRSTAMPIARASAMKRTILSVSSRSQLSSAAMNSTGWWALR